MTLPSVSLTDRMLALMLGALTALTIVVAAESHALCAVFCIHGDRMAETEICSSRA